jgi:hypothetical protein
MQHPLEWRRLPPAAVVQPTKDGNVTSGPQANQDSVASPRTFVIFLQFHSKATSLHSDSRIDNGIVLGVAIADFHCDREFFEIVEISMYGSIHNVGKEPAQAR